MLRRIGLAVIGVVAAAVTGCASVVSGTPSAADTVTAPPATAPADPTPTPNPLAPIDPGTTTLVEAEGATLDGNPNSVVFVPREDLREPQAAAEIVVLSVDPAQPEQVQVFIGEGTEASIVDASVVSGADELWSSSLPPSSLIRDTAEGSFSCIDLPAGRVSELLVSATSNDGTSFAARPEVLADNGTCDLGGTLI